MICFDRDVCFVDIETLGLDREAPIWEVAAIRIDPAGAEVGRVELQIMHQPGVWAESLPESFRKDYLARHQIELAVPFRQAAREVHEITSGAIIAGSNPSFDTDRLGLLLERAGLQPDWHYHPLDIPSMIAGVFAVASIPDGTLIPLQWNSSQLSRRIEVDPSEFARHTAMGDVEWCLAQWRELNGTNQ